MNQLLEPSKIIHDFSRSRSSQRPVLCWKHQFPFELCSEAKLGQDNTWIGDCLGTPGAAGALSHVPSLSLPIPVSIEFRKLCMEGVKERDCTKNHSSAICEANLEISALYGRKGEKYAHEWT